MEYNELDLTNQAIIEFKKSLFGVNKKEVFEYVDLLNHNLIKAREVYEEKLKELKSTNELINYEKSSRDEKIQQLSEGYESLMNERNELKNKLEGQQNLADELLEIKKQNEQFKERIERCKIIENENQQLKKQMVESNVVSKMREQQQAKLLAEIDSLKEQNRDILDASLDEQNRREAEISAKKLELTQLLQKHRFTLRQSRDALKALVIQFDESCELAYKIDVDSPIIPGETK